MVNYPALHPLSNLKLSVAQFSGCNPVGGIMPPIEWAAIIFLARRLFSGLPDMITGAWVTGSLSEVWWLQAALSRSGAAVVSHDFLILDLTVAVGSNADVGVVGCIATDGNSNNLVSIRLDRLEQHGAQIIYKNNCCASSKIGTRTAV